MNSSKVSSWEFFKILLNSSSGEHLLEAVARRYSRKKRYGLIACSIIEE